jgi:exosome complex component RRP46
MSATTEPAVILSPLPRADGSATFSQNGYTITGAVNGPIEVQRRDELPEEAAVDVIVRPAAGVGGTWNGRDLASAF